MKTREALIGRGFCDQPEPLRRRFRARTKARSPTTRPTRATSRMAAITTLVSLARLIHVGYKCDGGHTFSVGVM